ncbi:MAG: type II toxin-antitoxin system RelE/ParE family toxin, partial [Bacteroidetes bacterium]|nr:type II toxin-antitoxin system RelE/ParE family toxin [Bacteroidota bacterium]
MRPYELTSAAKADLREIVRYTIERWGEEQAEHYAKSLEAEFLKIASNKVVSRQF